MPLEWRSMGNMLDIKLCIDVKLPTVIIASSEWAWRASVYAIHDLHLKSIFLCGIVDDLNPIANLPCRRKSSSGGAWHIDSLVSL